MVDHIQETELKTFLSDLDDHKSIQSKYNSIGFLDELLGVEKHYFELRHKLCFDPFLKSLQMRMDKYAITTRDLSKSDKQILDFLYAATLSKLCSIQNISKHVSTVDLLKYLKLIHEHIEDLQKFKNIHVINEYRKNFNNSIDKKSQFR